METIFIWKDLLWSLVIIPVLIGLQACAIRRRERSEKFFPGTKYFFNKPTNIRGALFIAATAVLLIGAARPVNIETLLAYNRAVIIAIDISGSMSETDIKPTRIDAAKSAAIGLIKQCDDKTTIGIVAFGSTAGLVQAPTTNFDDAISAMNRLDIATGMAAGTAVGSAIETALAALDELPNKTGVIVLLSDGRTNEGTPPLEAAKVAVERNIRIFTVGIGSNRVANIGLSLDEETLRSISNLTGGAYRSTNDEIELETVLKDILPSVVWETKRTEITFAFTAVGGILMVVCFILQLL